jgi:hypothetical protein
MLSQQEISDRLELIDLMVRYAHAVDTRSWDDFDDIFTADATIDYSAFGGSTGTVAETKDYLASVMPTFPAFQHLVSNPMLDIDGDAATGRTMCFNPMAVARPDGDEGEPRAFFCASGTRTGSCAPPTAGASRAPEEVVGAQHGRGWWARPH